MPLKSQSKHEAVTLPRVQYCVSSEWQQTNHQEVLSVPGGKMLWKILV